MTPNHCGTELRDTAETAPRPRRATERQSSSANSAANAPSTSCSDSPLLCSQGSSTSARA